MAVIRNLQQPLIHGIRASSTTLLSLSPLRVDPSPQARFFNVFSVPFPAPCIYLFSLCFFSTFRFLEEPFAVGKIIFSFCRFVSLRIILPPLQNIATFFSSILYMVNASSFLLFLGVF